MAEGKMGIVIVNYNGANYQNDALRSIYASSYTNFEVIIVDSASKDNSVELARKEYPQIHFLLQSENVGVAKGNNIGIRYALDVLGVDYVLLINNDIELDKNTLQRLMEKADEIFPDSSKMKKQMGYANSKTIPFVALVGENEMNEGKVTLKNMETGEQKLVSPEQLISELS